MVKRFIDRAPIARLSRWINLPRSNYYYKAHPGQRGKKASTQTLYEGTLVDNELVIEDIRKLIQGPYNAYGYQNINDDLRDLGYVINKKKTYRLMDEHNLLLGKAIRCGGKRKWVQHRKILASKPLEYLCLDIKYIWVHGEAR